MSDKSISVADLTMMRKMQDKLTELAVAHSQLRTNFLKIESQLIQSTNQVHSDLRKLAEDLAKAKGISSEELKDWRLDLETGTFVSVIGSKNSESAGE